jgi:hypothetical protein
MRKIDHIVNPVLVDNSSDLFIAQPITFETMRSARRFAEGQVEVEFYTAQYPEDHPMVPADFRRTPDLEESVLDYGHFRKDRKLPLLRDILDRLYRASEAEYLIYTNVDISLQPHFYLALSQFIEAGYDAFVINRRTISDQFTTIKQIPLMYAQVGQPHRGWDCFIFRRDAYPHYRLGTICLGAPRVGLALLANLIAHAHRFMEFKNQHLSFHLGNDRGWQGREYSDYARHNTQEILRILAELEKECGPFERSSPPGSFLFKQRRLGFAYELWARYMHIPVQVKRRLVGVAERDS